MSRTTAQNPVKDLAYRATDGLEVALLWDASASSASVAVSDFRTGEAFELAVRNEDNAFDVFHHPYAYAAHRGVDFGVHTSEEHTQAVVQSDRAGQTA
jgi:hypothetical protein